MLGLPAAGNSAAAALTRYDARASRLHSVKGPFEVQGLWL